MTRHKRNPWPYPDQRTEPDADAPRVTKRATTVYAQRRVTRDLADHMRKFFRTSAQHLKGTE